jgi:hypothetical protein
MVCNRLDPGSADARCLGEFEVFFDHSFDALIGVEE